MSKFLEPILNMEELAEILDEIEDVTDFDSMSLSELDGYLTGLVVCPVVVPPGDWLPMTWGSGIVKPFKNKAQSNRFMQLVMGHFNFINKRIEKPDYQPIYVTDPVNGSLNWELWADSFGEAMEHKIEPWEDIEKLGSAEEFKAIKDIRNLIAISKGVKDTLGLAEQALTLIPNHVKVLNEYAMAQLRKNPPASMAEPAPYIPRIGPKIGRNELCTCGSGKKYKKCCGLN